MKVLVDTPIWSYALRSRRSTYQTEVNELISLIKDQRVLLVGFVRQEILSGYSDLRRFKKLRKKLSYFENTPVQDIDYETAAEFYNRCRKSGVQGSHIDFLLCAVANRLDAPIFTTDRDFALYQSALPISLHEIASAHP